MILVSLNAFCWMYDRYFGLVVEVPELGAVVKCTGLMYVPGMTSKLCID